MKDPTKMYFFAWRLQQTIITYMTNFVLKGVAKIVPEINSLFKQNLNKNSFVTSLYLERFLKFKYC
jgi:hypothetical protein